MVRLKATKTSLYRLVAEYVDNLPPMRSGTQFIKYPRRQDYAMDWITPEWGTAKSRMKRAGGSWNCWGTFPGWKCSPGTAPQGGTPGETRRRRNRRTTWHKRNGPPACGWVWR